MSVAEMFSDFLSNLVIQNRSSISDRYGEITAALNKEFRNTESKIDNSLQVGSFGRGTAINGISDLDMLYIMPSGKWDEYKGVDGTSKILDAVEAAISARYPTTTITVDRCVVAVTYTNFHIEVQPVFKDSDDNYCYPDKDIGWKTTKPREEMKAVDEMNSRTNQNYRRLAKMVRAWRDKHGVVMSGLLIDTLVHRFFQQTTEYDDKSYLYYDWISRDFFKFLSEEDEQNFYGALGSNQRVKVVQKFQSKAKKAYNLCLEAIKAENQKNVNDKWKEVFGRPFPANAAKKESARFASNGKLFQDTEQFIDDTYPIRISYPLRIDCEVLEQTGGFLKRSLREMLTRGLPLFARKKLRFYIVHNTAPRPYQIKWKVLNRGDEAEKRNKIRGEILDDLGSAERLEPTEFRGDHLVECYIIKDGFVVARDRIEVPISTNGQN